MTYLEFFESTKKENPPDSLSFCLQSLWYDSKEDWERAHELCQKDGGTDGSWVHAYLHRKEGDQSNAQYWYAKAGKTKPSGSLEEERKSIVEVLVKNE
jgi:hypothetical protein